MRKISKLSLVAALAVAGFSTANAKPLEEAIKDVDVSGSVVYRYNDYNNKALELVDPTDPNEGTKKRGSDVNNNYKVGLNLSSKVNDFAKFNSRFLVANYEDGGLVELKTQHYIDKYGEKVGSDQNVATMLSEAYFGLTAIKNTTINVGKQALMTPWTVARDAGNEQTGTGVLGLSTWGPVTIAAAYFNQTNLDQSGNLAKTLPTLAAKKSTANVGTFDIKTAALIGNFGPITADVWYLTMDNTFKTYNVGVEGKFDLSKGSNIDFEVRYIGLSPDDKDALKNQKLTKIAVNSKFSIVNARLAYAKAGKDGGLTALDSDAKTAMASWNINTLDMNNDSDYMQAALGVDILKNLNLTANYGQLKDKKLDYKLKEVYGQLTYKMSKNLSTYIRYGTFTNDRSVLLGDGTKTQVNDDKRGRLHVEYTF